MHCNLQYVEENKDFYIFKSSTTIIADEWKATSGSAVFNQDGKVVGMAVEISFDQSSRPIIKVVPYKTILRSIDHLIDTKK